VLLLLTSIASNAANNPFKCRLKDGAHQPERLPIEPAAHPGHTARPSRMLLEKSISRTRSVSKPAGGQKFVSSIST
jgi:hypothetical protein